MNANKIQEALKIQSAVAKALNELGEVPSGHIYATLAGSVTFEAYESLLRQLVANGVVARRGDVLTWVG